MVAAMRQGGGELLLQRSTTLPAKLQKGAGKAAVSPTHLSCILLNRLAGVGIGFLPEGAAYTTLERPTTVEKQEWVKIDLQGLVGWIGEA